ncbi:uncharacterized protein [Tursiops truncatus]|uniref:uncharacterized protein isoform X3 n=1 Tax=Tursiops truncatus TaxID=9739 RepID=UPI003CCF6E63
MRFSMLLTEMWPGLSKGCIPLESPPRLRSQAQVTEALRQAVQGLLEEREQQKYQISALEASLRLLQGGPEQRVLLLEQRLEGLRRELQGLRS